MRCWNSAAFLLSAPNPAQPSVPSALSAVAKCFFLLLVSWQFSASARATNITPDGGAYTLAPVPSSIDGIDCITADDADEEPLQICDDSSDLPDDPVGGGAVVWADKASIPSRLNQDPPQFLVTNFNIAPLCSLGTDPIPLLPVPAFYSLHEHIRERAPPSVA